MLSLMIKIYSFRFLIKNVNVDVIVDYLLQGKYYSLGEGNGVLKCKQMTKL